MGANTNIPNSMRKDFDSMLEDLIDSLGYDRATQNDWWPLTWPRPAGLGAKTMAITEGRLVIGPLSLPGLKEVEILDPAGPSTSNATYSDVVRHAKARSHGCRDIQAADGEDTKES
ncbi:hypothetical protein Y032_0020g152 [Ancylostoma ceylanicum]|uniref:Uncharacterized protein n=1 Tax=Ancylostoma ceylanicum TaxID=53326 RepID=A0A016V0J1_9BILA|nr:hypothetical protein Y032_0020g152 [Ancylostoma ceylanicum]